MIGKNIVLDLLYPQRCPLCDAVQPYQGSGVCPSCMKKLKGVREPCCLKCGKTITNGEEEYCQDCVSIPKSFLCGYPVFEYTEGIRGALYDFKYKNQRSFADFFAECIYRRYGGSFKRICPDGLVPVPVHPRKKRSRGYNQADLLAKALAARLGLVCYSNYLVRQVNTTPQKELNDISRMKNLKNAFKIGENKIKLNKVLLVDDIYTSGATVEACTRVLLSAGVESVYYTSVAIGKGF